MSTPFTLEFLQEKIGAEYVETNPVTGKPRLVLGLNEVWNVIDENGGVAEVAKRFDLPEELVWGWVDDHYVPDQFVDDLAWPGTRAIEMQLPSTGYEDPITGACWPWTWRLLGAECFANRYVRERDLARQGR